MRKKHPLAADVIQFVFCTAVAIAVFQTYDSDRSHTWTKYGWLAVALIWCVWSLSAFDRLWKRFREGGTS